MFRDCFFFFLYVLFLPNALIIFFHGTEKMLNTTDDDTIEIGDYVIVPAGKDNHEAVVEVVEIEYFSKEDAPLPIEKTKAIITYHWKNKKSLF